MARYRHSDTLEIDFIEYDDETGTWWADGDESPWLKPLYPFIIHLQDPDHHVNLVIDYEISGYSSPGSYYDPPESDYEIYPTNAYLVAYDMQITGPKLGDTKKGKEYQIEIPLEVAEQIFPVYENRALDEVQYESTNKIADIITEDPDIFQ